MSLKFFALMMLLAPAPAHMVGSTIGSETGTPRPMRVQTYEGKILCTITLVDGGNYAQINAKKCTAVGNFAKVVKVSGTYARQSYEDADGNEVAYGKQHSDGYWFYTPDGKRYQLYRQP